MKICAFDMTRIESRKAVGMADLKRALAVRTRLIPAGAEAFRRMGLRLACVAAAVFVAAALIVPAAPARAVEAIVTGPDQERVDLSALAELYAARGDRFSVDTAPGTDGIAGRMSVSAKTEGTNPNWAVFALNNPTSQTVTLWLMAPRYDLLGSKVVWPDLDAPRITKVSVSLGFNPERLDNDYADVYRLGSLNELEDLDLFEESRNGVLIIEWGNAVATAMPDDHLRVDFEVTGPTDRLVRLVPQGAWRNRSLKEMVE